MSVIFVTMVYNDDEFLRIWLAYYERFVPRTNLHIVTHGPQPNVHEIARGCTIVEAPRDPRDAQMERQRFDFISKYCSAQTEHHDRVVFNDVDEMVVLDPSIGDNLAEYLSGIDASIRVVTPLGIEIIHRTDLENDFDFGRGVFAQRRFVRTSGWYCKPCIINTEMIWGPDGHGSSFPEFHHDENLFLVHLKWFDQTFHRARHRERVNMWFTDDSGTHVRIGGGSWQWDDKTYEIAANQFLGYSIDKHDRGWDFSDIRGRLHDSFGLYTKRPERYKVDWFVSTDLREVPERFVGVL